MKRDFFYQMVDDYRRIGNQAFKVPGNIEKNKGPFSDKQIEDITEMYYKQEDLKVQESYYALDNDDN